MVTIWAAVITGLAVILVGILGFVSKKLIEIHVLVNSRLDAALEQIKDLQSERDKLRDDKLRHETP